MAPNLMTSSLMTLNLPPLSLPALARWLCLTATGLTATGLVIVAPIPRWSAAAQAGQITTWHYDANQNQFEFTTDESVQPRAQLMVDPMRLVIDLPGTSQTPVSQEIGGEVERVRIEQLDEQTTRIIVELAPGYTLDPQQVHFRGISPTQWTVQLPQPQLANLATPSAAPSTSALTPTPAPISTAPPAATSAPTTAITSLPSPSASSSASPQATRPQPISSPPGVTSTPARVTLPSRQPAAQVQTSQVQASQVQTSQIPANQTQVNQTQARSSQATRASQSTTSGQLDSGQSDSSRPNRSTPTTPSVSEISSIRVTEQGLLISTQGSDPKVSMQRSRSGGSITVRLENTHLADSVREGDRNINRHGVDEIDIEQSSDNVVEIKLDVARRSPDWEVRTERTGLLLLPNATTVAEKAADPEPPTSMPARVPARVPARANTAITSPSRSSRSTQTVAEQPSPARLPPDANSSSRPQTATIEGVDLDLSSSQLLIQTDRPVAHSAQWQGGVYVINLAPARLASRVAGPQLSSTDPLRRVNLRQVDDQTVAVSVQPASGIQFGALNLITPQTLALEMQRATASTTASTSRTTPTNRSPLTLPSLTPNGRIIVVIDPGHGGGDPGAVGISNLHEADVVLAIGQQVASLLQQQGIQAMLTRNSDVEIDLEPRVQMAEQIRANLFVSIHANSMGMDRPDINGTETYYYSSGEALAETIQNSIVSGLGVDDRGVRQARFYVLKKTSMPAVLVETGYVTGNEDAAQLANTTYQSQMAAAIARGILLYIQQQGVVGSR